MAVFYVVLHCPVLEGTIARVLSSPLAGEPRFSVAQGSSAITQPSSGSLPLAAAAGDSLLSYCPEVF